MDFLSRWLADPDLSLLSDATLRLARHVPSVKSSLDKLLEDPVQRALCGLEDGLDAAEQVVQADFSRSDPAALARVVRASIALSENNRPNGLDMGALETVVEGDLQWWVPVARMHALQDLQRENQARMDSSIQDIPYVFPGDLHLLQVHVLAIGERVVPALHVDWVRKLTGLVASAMILDCRSLGLWFLPLLDVLDEKKLLRPIRAIERARKLSPGSLGLAALYLDRLGQANASMLRKASPADLLLLALGQAADLRRSG